MSADSKNKEAAYLFSQWATSPSISLQRVQLPYTLRDPYRISHYKSKQSGSRWPSAPQYLKALSDAANNAVLDPIMTGAADYANALDRAMTAIYAGKDIQRALNDAAKEWDAITNKLGVDKAEGVVRGVPEAARLDQPEHGRQEGPGSQDHRLTPERGDRRRDNGREEAVTSRLLLDGPQHPLAAGRAVDRARSSP